MSYMDTYKLWLENVSDEAKAELLGYTEDEIKESFYKDLEFGTGGLRGIIGMGTNRMNIYTVRKATQGIAEEIISSGEENIKRGVVVAHDSRNMSREFAEECVKVLCGNGIKAYLFDELRPTPELSFAVRYLNAARGIVITASHNPKEYNGYKAYGEDGGQLPPHVSDEVIKIINKTDIFGGVRITENPGELLTVIGSEVDEAYLNAIREQALDIDCSDLKVVYTPIHGSGNKLVRGILNKIGTGNVTVVPEQEAPDGNFPTVKSPNPEYKETFNLAIELAKRENADIVIGTDPDSDRIGVVVNDGADNYFVLNGNQTGTLLAEFLLRKKKEMGILPENGAVIKTIVTSNMIDTICGAYGIACENVLTGFKFIGEKIKDYEENDYYRRFLIGMEESYGYLVGTYARDKDAVVASMLVIQMAADYKKQGLTLYDGLMKLYREYGYFMAETVSIELQGMEGAEKISGIMKKLREKTPEIDGVEIKKVLDYSEGLDGLPKSNVLKYLLPDEGWFVARPSGTEPKIKIYFEVMGKTQEEADNKLLSVKNRVIDYISTLY